MFSRTKIEKSMKNCSVDNKIEIIKDKLDHADAIVVGAGAGLSTSGGLTYTGERFKRFFSDFEEKYGIHDIYSGGFYPFKTQEELWGWWSRQVFYNRYDFGVCQCYIDLLKILKDRNYFVLTTNADHQFIKAGFIKERLFYTQGDYGLFQCSVPCHNKTYDNEKQIRNMITAQNGTMTVPSELIPRCPKCGEVMTMNLRKDSTFVQDEGWNRAARRYDFFIDKWKSSNIVYLELGVGYNTPGIIKYPFWQMTYQNHKATYVCINMGEAICPKEIEKQSICINEDISITIASLLK